jgi:hypothetical protein
MGYLSPQGGLCAVNTVINNIVTGVNITLQKATALLYGRVLDTSGNPVANLDLYSGDGLPVIFESRGTTDTNGYYYLGATSTNGNYWRPQADVPSAPALAYYDLSALGGANFSPGMASDEDFTAFLAPYTIYGTLSNANSQPIVGVRLVCSGFFNNQFWETAAVTDNNGNYVIHAADHNVWHLDVDCSLWTDNLASQGYNCVNGRVIYPYSQNVMANFEVPGSGYEEINGRIIDSNNIPVTGGVTVYAQNQANEISSQTTTDTNGFFEFIVPDNSSWNLSVDCAQLANLGYNCASLQVATVGTSLPYFNDFTVQPSTPPFFSGFAPLANNWNYLGAIGGDQYAFGYYSTLYFPYTYHLDLGWEYFIDARNGAHGAYFFDYADGVFFYTEPGIFPYIYDFNLNAWMYCAPQDGTTDRYQSGPRWFYNLSTSAWVNHL